MIDKNDVKMPVYRAISNEIDSKVENLLELLGDVDNKQELRLKSDYYSHFHWFGGNTTGKADRSYFSYQEEAVYDFIFNLNRSGILSDQVGMGKTIEAGMIISELASRNELRSLLIIVPNEIMAEKWEYELENKFGIKYFKRTVDGVEEIYPQVTALKSYGDFCKCIFDCLVAERFPDLARHVFTHKYTGKDNGSETLESLIRSYVAEDIQKAIRMINQGFAQNDMEEIQVAFDKDRYFIRGTKLEAHYTYDEGGEIRRYLLNNRHRPTLSAIINIDHFTRQYSRIINRELQNLYIMLGDYFARTPGEISSISESMTNRYPFLVIPITYLEEVGDTTVTRDFLNHCLLGELKNYKHKCIVQAEKGEIKEEYEEYRIIDFFIDVGYQTLIVDEVHDYIDVSAKLERMKFHRNPHVFKEYSSKIYNRYELFDDYYFIKKSSLYKKLKALADKASRKIFLTATPIKSDMVDFYLLTLLASNKDSEAYRKISANLDNAFPRSADREMALTVLYNTFKSCVEETSAKHFCDYSSYFLASEHSDETGAGGRYRYAYFNNSFLRTNLNNKDLIQKYMLSQLSYMTMEEVILELILAYNAENSDRSGSEMDVKRTINELENLLSDEGNYLQTRVVFRTLFNNNIKVRFEEDFTDAEGKPIKRIRDLLEKDDGARKWNRTYRKYGIRHTRHQTYNLAKCRELRMLSDNRQERYQNLPVWPRRDGKIIFLVRDDIFFDCYLNVKRDLPASSASVVRMEDLPNFERLNGSESEKAERFRSATAIFDYIDQSMSGGQPDTHEPYSSRYESVELDDGGMVDYKLALINKLMDGQDHKLGSVKRKVLLFAENGRERIVEWFKYQKCMPLYDPDHDQLDEKKLAEYRDKWKNSYGIDEIGNTWEVSENADDLSGSAENLLVIIDPKRYEKGVDLQKADTIINFDINYCPLKMEQRIGRIDRIRPNSQVAQINIISFVPMNDMSGYVINFFANELKMFTQWMGETTGIVSVPDEDTVGNSNRNSKGEDVSFEGKVTDLETYYRHIYTLCKEDVPADRIEQMATAFAARFGCDKNQTIVDFKFLAHMRPFFDCAFRNSVSPRRAGYRLPNGSTVMRFNSRLGVFNECGSNSCEGCTGCSDQTLPLRNRYADFKSACEKFFTEGEAYYNGVHRSYNTMLSSGTISGEHTDNYQRIVTTAAERMKVIHDRYQTVRGHLVQTSANTPFLMPFDQFESILGTMKVLYWDEVVEKYIQIIIAQFHNQCDSVLRGARLFEKFVKTLSIADFMNNMEGNV